MPNEIYSDIGPDQPYSTVSSWIAADCGAAGSDLVAQDEKCIGEIHGTIINESVPGISFNCDESRNVILRAADGQGWDGDTTDLTDNTICAGIVTGSGDGSPTITVSCDHMVIGGPGRGLRLEHQGTSNTSRAVRASSVFKFTTMDSCLCLVSARGIAFNAPYSADQTGMLIMNSLGIAGLWGSGTAATGFMSFGRSGGNTDIAGYVCNTMAMGGFSFGMRPSTRSKEDAEAGGAINSVSVQSSSDDMAGYLSTISGGSATEDLTAPIGPTNETGISLTPGVNFTDISDPLAPNPFPVEDAPSLFEQGAAYTTESLVRVNQYYTQQLDTILARAPGDIHNLAGTSRRSPFDRGPWEVPTGGVQPPTEAQNVLYVLG